MPGQRFFISNFGNFRKFPETRVNVQKNKGAISVTQLDESLEIGSRQQINPQDWEKITAILTILKPILYCAKAAEGDGVAISEVIPLLKRLNIEINSSDGTGVQLMKSLFSAKLNATL
jgi:hypothetical protein